MKPSTLELQAGQLFGPRRYKHEKRRWTIGSMVLVLLAQRFADRGFLTSVSLKFAAGIGVDECAKLIADDAAKLCLVAWPQAGKRREWSFALAHDVDELIALLSPDGGFPDAVAIDLRPLVDEAFRTVAAALLGKVPADA